jgi:hypothetical protein
MNDSTKIVGTPSYAGRSKRVWFAIFTAIGTVGTVAAVLGHLSKTIAIAGAVATAICAGLNQYFSFTATGPVTTTKP